jgi:uroporphyrinogen decarboxylase
MTSRQRIIASVEHREPDRLPVDFGGTNCSTIHRIAHKKLMELMGFTDFKEEMYDIIQQVVRPDKRLQKIFGSDTYLLLPGFSDDFELKITKDSKYSYLSDEWGAKYRKPHIGFFYDFYTNPLSGIKYEQLKNYKFPDPTNKGRTKDLSRQAKEAFEKTEYALIMSDGIWGMLQHSALLLGFHRLYEALASEHKLITAILDRLLEYEINYWESVFIKVKEYVQIIHISDDLGGQFGPNINPVVYRKLIKPYHKKLIDFIRKKANVKILFHSCGSVYEFIPDFIEMGIDILNPVQVSAAKMDSNTLKKEFGNDITFWGGGIDTQKVLPFGTPEEVRNEVKKRISDFAPGGGFVFTTVHNIQANIPAVNIKQMFETVKEYGNYPIII